MLRQTSSIRMMYDGDCVGVLCEHDCVCECVRVLVKGTPSRLARVSDTIIAFIRRMQGIPECRPMVSDSGYDQAIPSTTERFRARPSR